jgi:hypothetical protein
MSPIFYFNGVDRINANSFLSFDYQEDRGKNSCFYAPIRANFSFLSPDLQSRLDGIALYSTKGAPIALQTRAKKTKTIQAETNTRV